jgi:hypothetical protein
VIDLHRPDVGRHRIIRVSRQHGVMPALRDRQYRTGNLAFSQLADGLVRQRRVRTGDAAVRNDVHAGFQRQVERFGGRSVRLHRQTGAVAFGDDDLLDPGRKADEAHLQQLMAAGAVLQEIHIELGILPHRLSDLLRAGR